MERSLEAAEKRADGVAVCIATCRRPEGLLRLLQSLDALAFEGAAPRIEIHVVDNDPDQSARPVCESCEDWLRAPIHYRVEPRRGVAHARNACVASALDRTEWIAFVDDDQVVEPHWLARLLEVQRATGADVVTGPVLPRRPPDAPRWLVEGRFFDVERFPTGSERPTAFTGNVLVRAAALRALEPRFDPRLDRGEDTELFFRLAGRGHRIVWADDAIAHEAVPPERLRLGFVLRRAYHEGLALARIEQRLGRETPARSALRGLARGLQGIALACAPWPVGAGARARGLRHASYGLGRGAGLLETIARGD